MAQEPRRRETGKKASIVKAALALFKQHGVRRVSVGELCDAAGVSKGTFYNYFDNKVELARHLVDCVVDQMISDVDNAANANASFHEQVDQIIQSRIAMVDEWGPQVLQALYHADDELSGYIAERGHAARAHLVEFIRNAQRAGHVDPKIPPGVILGALDKLNELARDESLVREAGGWQGLTLAINRLIFYGITRPGA